MSDVGSDDIHQALLDLRDILRDWGAVSEAVSEQALDSLLAALRQGGWKRRDVYALLQQTCRSDFPPVPPASLDYVSDVETSLTGDVAAGSVMRFADDPSDDPQELLAHVRSGRWRIEP